MIDKELSRSLIRILIDRGIQKDYIKMIGMIVRRPWHMEQMIDWLEKNPTANATEVGAQAEIIAGWNRKITQERAVQMKQLAHRMKEAGMPKDDALIASSMVRREKDEAELLEWMKTHPQATTGEIVEEARAITKRNNGY